MPTAANAAITLEILLILAGVALLWRCEFSARARTERRAPALRIWNISLSDFALFLCLVIGGAAISGLLAGLLLRYRPMGTDGKLMFATAASQLGIFAGVVIFRLHFERVRSPGVYLPLGKLFQSGLVTFLIALPVMTATSVGWEALLRAAGLPVDPQDSVRMFIEADSPLLLGVMIMIACVGAPLTEELLFRGGLFRYMRTRTPRWMALVLPALFFSALHVNWATLNGLGSVAPLTVLAVIFSLAYERTGNLGTTMIAHALFNLHTVLLVFAGVGT